MSTVDKIPQRGNAFIDALNAGTQLADFLLPKTTTRTAGPSSKTASGRTDTEQTMLTLEEQQALLQHALERNQGLADVAGGQAASGLYNSSVTTQLANDLLARSATSVATTAAPVVSTVGSSTENASGSMSVEEEEPRMGLGSAALTGAALWGASKLLTPAAAVAPAALGTFGASVAPAAAQFASNAGVSGMLAGIPTSAAPIGVGATPSLVGGAGKLLSSQIPGTSVSVGGALPYLPAVMDLASGNVKAAALGGAATYAGSKIGAATLATKLGTFAGPVGAVVGSILGRALSRKCFLTTAACQYFGRPDDCDELQTLRGWRDTWMREHHAEDIEQYYDIAPVLVKQAENLPHNIRVALYQAAYNDYILPTVALIKQGENQLAYETYKKLVNFFTRTVAKSVTEKR